jgi:hypothetical protein
MLEEFYILKDTNLFYYYAKDGSEYDLNAIILSSGLLSALNSFTLSSRSNNINSFQTDKEIFKFTNIPDSNYNLVYVFNLNDYNEKHSQVIIQNIFDLITESDFKTKISNERDNYAVFGNELHKKLTESIKFIIDFKIPKQLSNQNLEELLKNEKAIDYCLIKEQPSGNVLAKYSKRATLLGINFEDEHELMLSVIQKALENLELADKFLVINFESENQQFMVFNMNDYNISYLSSELKSTSYYTGILKNFMFSNNLFQYAKLNLAEFSINSKYSRDKNGKVLFENGIVLPTRFTIYLGTLAHNILKFSKFLLLKGLKMFSVVYVTKKNELSLLKVTNKDGQMELTINND